MFPPHLQITPRTSDKDPVHLPAPSQPIDWPLVSVIIPIFNEARYIGQCLTSVVAQDYPSGRLEILVVDGGSTDDSLREVATYSAQDPRIHILHNPEKFVSSALNIGIRTSCGVYILRVDGHCILEPDYVRNCVWTLLSTGVANVGGPQRAIGVTPVGKALALATGSPFGVGDARYRLPRQMVEPVDTVYLGAFPANLLRQVGGYAPDLIRNQDYELNYRLRQAGGTILLNPQVLSWYYGRSSWGAMLKQYFQYGYWKAYMLRRHPRSLRWRQLAAPALTAGILGGSLALLLVNLLFQVPLSQAGDKIPAIMKSLEQRGKWAYAFLLLIYAISNLLATGKILARHSREQAQQTVPWGVAFRLPLVFSVIHGAWGLGFWAGWWHIWHTRRALKGECPTGSGR
ncbi:MAG: glycosyltransferase family 2 protein [Chloroflexi bacterium]|nr:glycosyltransferase family 2 protein [Chloroflexota bacterium]